MQRLLLPVVAVALAAWALSHAAEPPTAGTPQRTYALALADVRKLPPKVACRTRYLSLYNLPAAEQKAYRAKLVRAWGSHLSREADFPEVREVSEDLLAVHIDEFAWDPAIWEKQAVEPYWHEWTYTDRWYVRPGSWLDPRVVDELYQRTGSKVPVVRADWWLFYSSRQLDLNNKEIGFGYYGWLGIADQKTYESLRQVDRKVAIKLGDELRAALPTGRSRVGQADRLIEWYSAYGDGEQGFWLTRDANDTSKGNTVAGNLDGDGFKEKARETYIGLPNRLWAVGAFDAAGKRQNTVPDDIAADNSLHHRGNDRRIHPASCFHCHTDGGLQGIDDWARRTLRPPLRIETEKFEEFIRLRRQYTSNLEAKIAGGRKRYTEALEACVPGLKPAEFSRLHAEAYYRYQLEPRTAAMLAREMGCSEECLLRTLRGFFESKNVKAATDKRRLAVLQSLIAREPEGVNVTFVEQFFADLQRIVCEYGGAP